MSYNYRAGSAINAIVQEERFNRHLENLHKSKVLRLERKMQAEIAGVEYDDRKNLFANSVIG